MEVRPTSYRSWARKRSTDAQVRARQVWGKEVAPDRLQLCAQEREEDIDPQAII